MRDPLPEIPLEHRKKGAYVDRAGNGQHGVYGVTKENLQEIREWLEKNGALGLRTVKNEVLTGTYVIYFKWEFRKNWRREER